MFTASNCMVTGGSIKSVVYYTILFFLKSSLYYMNGDVIHSFTTSKIWFESRD